MLRGLNRRIAIHFIIAASFVLLFATLEYRGFNPLIKAELATVDDRVRFGARPAANPEIVFLAIDAASTKVDQLDEQTIAASPALTLMHQGFPYPRNVYPYICDRLIGAGARVVAFDIRFPSVRETDPPWQAAIDKYRDHIVIAMNFSDDFVLGSSSLELPSPSLFPAQDPFDDRLGYVNYWADLFGTVREAQYRTNTIYINNHTEGAERLPMFYSLAARALQKGGHADLVPNDLRGRPFRFVGQPLSFPSHPLYEIFDPQLWEANYHHGEFFRDKIVLVGPQGDWSKDKLLTPMGLMDGAEIHVNAMNALLQNAFLYPASGMLIYAMIFGSGAAAFFLAVGITQIVWRFLAVALILAGYLAALMAAYNGPGWLLPAFDPLTIFSGATGIGFMYDFVRVQMERIHLRSTLERYVSRNVVKEYLGDAESYRQMLGGTRKSVTTLFSDIRGFTTMTESADSQQLVAKLNEYLTAMVECVFQHDGTLDKFIGDAVMAVWGNMRSLGPREDGVHAVRAARAMMEHLHRLNAKWVAEGKTEWHIGIGLNHGEVIVGEMGSAQRTEFTAIGDAVNLASRLESLTKEYHVDILIGENLAALVEHDFYLQTVDLVQVKGKTLPVRTFTVLGEKTEPLPPDRRQFLEAYEEGISAFGARDFMKARACFSRALEFQPGNHLATEYLASCEAFLQNPPDASWTGVRVMTKK